MSDHAELIARAESALEGVTEGPWHWNVRGFVGPASTEDDQSFGMICDEVAECTHSGGAMGANARFIATSRDLIPALIAALKASEARETVRITGYCDGDNTFFAKAICEEDTHVITIPTIDGKPVLTKCPHCGTAPVDMEEFG